METNPGRGPTRPGTPEPEGGLGERGAFQGGPLGPERRTSPEPLPPVKPPPGWERVKGEWPNGDASRFLRAGSVRWHVQRGGEGPELLLLHGTGASTHSWFRLFPLLARDFSVTAPDLPGHGFTARPDPSSGLSRTGMARHLDDLFEALGVRPQLIVGHSAGAAIGVTMALSGPGPEALVGLNPALWPVGPSLPPPASDLIARLVSSRTAGRLGAALARNTRVVDRLLRSTGSRVPEASRRWYGWLAGRSQHVSSVLTMMSLWDPRRLQAELSSLDLPVHLVAGSEDTWTPSAGVREAAGRISGATVREVPTTGHLTHEERPTAVARIVLDLAEDEGILTPRAS